LFYTVTNWPAHSNAYYTQQLKTLFSCVISGLYPSSTYVYRICALFKADELITIVIDLIELEVYVKIIIQNIFVC